MPVLCELWKRYFSCFLLPVSLAFVAQAHAQQPVYPSASLTAAAAGLDARREVHADASDDLTKRDGNRPPPSSGSTPAKTPDTIAELRGVGVDFSVQERDLREWLGNSKYTPYPAIAAALLNLLRPRGLSQPVYIDVIVWNYEHAPGVRSPRELADVNQDVLKASIVEGYNTRYGTTAQSLAEVAR